MLGVAARTAKLGGITA